VKYQPTASTPEILTAGTCFKAASRACWFKTMPKKEFLPDTPHREIPRQKLLIKDLDLSKMLTKATAFLGCDVEDFKKTTRASASRVLDRDLLLYVVWQLGIRTNS
jgi:hypothetical protein